MDIKINSVIISLIIFISCLCGNIPSISIESKYGKGEEVDPITFEPLGNY